MNPEQQWLEIQVRLVAGEPTESPFRGVLEVVDHDADEVVRYVVRKDRHRWRVETEDGAPSSIQGDEHRFTFGDDPTCPGRAPRREEVMDEVSRAVSRPAPSDLVEHEPASAPERVTHLGRDAWRICLPLPEKQLVLVEVLDAATGMLLESGTERFGPNLRWLEIEPVDGFPEETFTWDGDFAVAFGADDVPEDLRELHDAEQAREEARVRRGVEALGPVDLTVEVALDLAHLYVEPSSSFVNGTLSGGFDVHFLRQRSLDPDERSDLSWQDDAGRTWSVTGHPAAPPEVLQQVRDWLERRAPVLDLE